MTTMPSSTLRRLWEYLRPVLAAHWLRVAIAFACLLAAKGGLLVIPFLLKALVDRLDGTGTATSVALVVALVIAYGGARFANTLFGEIRDTLFGRVTERAMREVGLMVFKHVHRLDLDYHLNRRTGGLARDIERGTSGISFLMRFFIFNIAPTLFEIAMVAIILFVNYGMEYAGIVLLAVVAYVTFSFRATSWRTQFVREVNNADSSSNSRAVDSLLNYETVKYFTNEAFEASRYDRSLEEWELARRKNRLSLFALNGGQAAIIAISQTSMLAMAALEVRSAALSLGDFVLINQFMLQLFMPLGFLGFVYREIKASMANIEKLLGILDEKPAVTDQPNAQQLKWANGDIQFDDVTFAYDAQRPVLNGLNFTIHQGETVALVGASGAGKSTVVKLLFRFYDPTTGAIRIGDQDIRSVTLDSLRQAIGIVPQDCVLFNDSLRENIRYGDPTASDEAVEAAVDAAFLSAFVSKLPEGLDTVVGERGLKLSGGERQRVAIARAVLKSAPILIFDEATSSLDSQSEQAVMQAFRALAGNHTALVIAHRLSTVVDADRIVVLDHGRVVEQGNHQSLLVRDGHYARLWRTQTEREPNEQPLIA
ncbi:MAG: ABC transporter ATP-binding protein/permease [Halieaceae bacterium]|jgi:ATP-binding cassette subfamily B protein|nr:ABC transporter ATP-binding protein/permease [Halieaceae bacterium]